ncbi:MAG: hypothetical protein ABL974_19735, partial [Prosthecobacter sp.]
HETMSNIDAFFGPATRDAHDAEKHLLGVGLFMNDDCLPYCSVFHTRSCYKGFSYVFLTQAISGLHYHHSSYANAGGIKSKTDRQAGFRFPLDWNLVFASGLETYLVRDCAFLKSIHDQIESQSDLKIRRKYQRTWNLYKLQYPTFMRALESADMEPDFISSGDWSQAKADLIEWQKG